MFSKISWLDFFVIPHCNLQFERMSKSTISFEYIRSCHTIFSNNKVQFFHLCLNRQLSIYTRIFHWKIFDSVTCVKRFKIRYCKKSAISFEKSRFASILSLHNYRFFFCHQSLNRRFWSCGKLFHRKIVNFVRCFKMLVAVISQKCNKFFSRYSISCLSVMAGFFLPPRPQSRFFKMWENLSFEDATFVFFCFRMLTIWNFKKVLLILFHLNIRTHIGA